MKEDLDSNIISKTFSTIKSVLPQHKQLFSSVTVLIIAVMLVFTISCGKVEGPASEKEAIITELKVDDERRFQLQMSYLEDHSDGLAAAIRKQNWENIQRFAKILKNTSAVALTGKQREELPVDFVEFDTEYHLHALRLAEAAEAMALEQLNTEYKKIRQLCDHCHSIYR